MPFCPPVILQLGQGLLGAAVFTGTNGFVAAEAVAADAPTPDTYVMVDLMLACFGE